MSDLLDALDYVGSTLAKPGRAVRGVLGGRPGEAAAIIPFSDSLGLTDRSNEITGQDLMGQAGISTGTQWGDALAGVGVDIATDPLTWFGAGVGNAIGRNLGKAAVAAGPRYATTADDFARMVGAGTGTIPEAASSAAPGASSRARAAVQADEGLFDLGIASPVGSSGAPSSLSRSDDFFDLSSGSASPLSSSPMSGGSEFAGLPPGFTPTPLSSASSGDVGRAAAGVADVANSRAVRRAQEIMSDPNAARILQEIPPGSSLLRAGAEALALRTPSGDILRIGRDRFSPTGGPGRPVSDSMLQATRTVDIGASSPMRVERVPMAESVLDASVLTRRNPQTMLSPMDEARSAAQRSGLTFWDDHLGNVGIVNGKPVIIDPGAVGTASFTGAYQPVTQAAAPSTMSSLLLRALGGDDAIRAAIESGRTPTYTAPLTRLGAEGGAAAGEGGRAMRDRR